MTFETPTHHEMVDAEPLEFTGERFVPTETGELRQEHLHRYALCAELVRGKVVLDIACGEGYGTALLAQTAGQVIGVDISSPTVAHAATAYADVRNVRFEVGSCAAIPLADRKVDVVVSFETVEHITEHAAMLGEVRRVLRPDGILVISTPDRDVYTDKLGNRNQFHVRELNRIEFESLLQPFFSDVRLYAQRLATGSIVYPLDHAIGRSPITGYTESGGHVVTGVPQLPDPVYLIAVCSNRRDGIRDLAASLFLDSKEDLFSKQVAVARWAQDTSGQLREYQANWENLQKEHATTAQWAVSLDRELEDLRSTHGKLQQEHETVGAWGQSLAGQVADLERENATLDESRRALSHSYQQEVLRAHGVDAELKLARDFISEIHRSTSWRVTAPMRYAKRLFIGRPVSGRNADAHWLLLRKLFRSLPIAHAAKNKLRMWLFDHFHSHLTHLPFHANWAAHRDSMRAGLMRPDIVDPPPSLTLGEQKEKARNLVVPTSEAPVVSVIIPVYGKVEYTLQCLRSIAAHSPRVPYEIIVVDDNSPDDTASIVDDVKGVRLVTNATNLGFIGACNRGGSEARGDFLCFLNNDTEVGANWLDELHATFSEFTKVGLVGSKLVYPDGRLQEAGGIIWKDGSAWNYGRDADPTCPAYNYARQVDYCSGASIMIAAALFKELGGFDEHYSPAYGEDSDLALKIRQRGLKVFYQPLSMVVHHEGVTSGIDTSAGIKAYQIDNARKLYERWKPFFDLHQAPGEKVDCAKDRGATVRALVLDHCTPTPDQDAGSITALNLMLLLRHAGFQVTFIPEDNFLYMPDYTPELQRRGIEAIYAPHVTSVEQHLEAHGQRYDLVVIFRPTAAERHLESVRAHCSRAKVLFHTSDVHFLRMAREAELVGDESLRAAAEKMCEMELKTMASVDAVIVHSTAEKEFLKSRIPDEHVHVFPWAIPIRGTKVARPGRADIAFVGGYQHAPNVDAVKYFISEIFPLIRARIPGVRFFAIGSKPPPELLALAGPDVVVTGFVDDIGPLLDQMRVAVAPLRYGAGIKGKIGTTLSVGLPSVATSVAAEGMELCDGHDVLVADDPDRFADAVVRLYDDPALWDSLSADGLRFAEMTYGPQAAKRCMTEILRDLDFDREIEEPISIFGPTTKSIGPATPAAPEEADPAPPIEAPNGADAYRKKIEQELAIYEKQINVHDLPGIFHYWSNKHLAGLFRDAGFESVEEFFASNLDAAGHAASTTVARYLSIGSGNCDTEVAVAKRLLAVGGRPFKLECVDLNATMLDRGLAAAKEQGVDQHMIFTRCDFNTWTSAGQFDGIMANQSLHHVMQLEHLFGEVHRGLGPDGRFVISDIIGRNGHQRWPEALAIVHRFWEELPEPYKFNVLLNRHEPYYENWDCSSEGFEGIRAQDILPLLLRTFHCEKFVGFGNAIDIFVDRCFGHHFDGARPWDRAFIDRVHDADEDGFRTGSLTPTHMMAVFTKQPVAQPYFSRGLTPQASVRSKAMNK